MIHAHRTLKSHHQAVWLFFFLDKTEIRAALSARVPEWEGMWSTATPECKMNNKKSFAIVQQSLLLINLSLSFLSLFLSPSFCLYLSQKMVPPGFYPCDRKHSNCPMTNTPYSMTNTYNLLTHLYSKLASQHVWTGIHSLSQKWLFQCLIKNYFNIKHLLTDAT